MKEQYSLTKKIRFFCNQQKGSITIEFLFAIVILGLILAFMADLIILRSTLGKLDNTSYSLVNILRERKQLFEAKEDIESKDVEDFRKLAKRMIYGDKDSEKELYIIIESISFKPSNNLDTEKPKIHKAPYYGDQEKCTPYKKLKDLQEIAPRSEAKSGRKLPLYQVTICIPSYSIFKAITLSDTARAGRNLRSSSVTVVR